MDKYSKEILTILKNQYISVVGDRPFQNTSEAREYYLEDIEDNLYMPMSAGAYSAYGQGSGNEISSGKMNALRSSSAMTYNLLWNQIGEITKSQDGAIENGIYQVEFEKQYHTLNPHVSNRPANLDAFLYCEENKAAIACEMKMTEWLFNKPGTLKNAYLKPDNYIEKEAGEVFISVAKDLILYNDYEDPDVEKEEYPCRFSRYDGFQMLKHAIACYTACEKEEQRIIEKIALVNCVWTLPNADLLTKKHRERYRNEETLEIAEFNQFKEAMEPVRRLFARKGIVFDLVFYKYTDFLRMFNKTEKEVEYLKRYTLTSY